MAFLNGVFKRLYNFVTDRDAGIKILASKQDAEWTNMAQGLTDIVQGTQPFKGTVKAPFGTAAAPSHTFDTDTDTGMYRPAVNTVTLSAGGVDKLTVSPTEANLSQHLNISVGQSPSNGPLYGIEITGPTPSIGFVDTTAGSGMIQYSNNGFYFRGDSVNDGTIGSSGNTTDYELFRVTDIELEFKGFKVYHAANGGAGSGMDADRLDGQEGAYYRNASNLNAGTIANERIPSTLTGVDIIKSSPTANEIRLTGNDFTSAAATSRFIHDGTSGNVRIMSGGGGYQAYLVQTGVSTAQDCSSRLAFSTGASAVTPEANLAIHGYVGMKGGNPDVFISSTLNDVILETGPGKGAYVNTSKISTVDITVDDIRLGTEVYVDIATEGDVKAPAGHVVTGFKVLNDFNTRYHIEGFFCRPLQFSKASSNSYENA